jgi:ABC-2 type transport system ATP-binding protein
MAVNPDIEARPKARASLAGSASEPFLVVSDLAKAYGERKAVDGVSFEIGRGECFGLLGPNGAGKTTTILAICNLITPDAGDVRVGQSLTSPGLVQTRSQIGYVPQEIALYEDLTGRENLRFFGRLYGLDSKALKKRVESTLEFVELEARGDEKVAAYSGGMKRRLNIAAALLHEPGLLVLDEPTVGIDPQSRNAIFENLLTLRAEGVALLYTTHYMEEAERLCDRIGIIDDGRILAEGSSESLLKLLGESTDKVRVSTGRPPDAALLADLARLDGVASVKATPGGPEMAVRDVARVLPAVLEAFAERDTQITGLSVEQPDLETVFLHLTGKALRDA